MVEQQVFVGLRRDVEQLGVTGQRAAHEHEFIGITKDIVLEVPQHPPRQVQACCAFGDRPATCGTRSDQARANTVGFQRGLARIERRCGWCCIDPIGRVRRRCLEHVGCIGLPRHGVACSSALAWLEFGNWSCKRSE